MMDLSKQISEYATRVLALNLQHDAVRGSPALFDELYEQVSQGIEELQIVDEELKQRETELERATESILRERTRYQNLFALAPDAYLLTDSEGVLIEANARAEELFELSAALLRGKPLVTFIASKRQRGSFRSWFSTLRKVEANSGIDLTLNARRRGRFPAEIHVAPVPGDNPQSINFLWVIRDVSTTRRARRDAELAALVRASGDAILTQARDGRITTWNAAAQHLYGYEQSQILGRSIERLIAPECLREHAEAIASLSEDTPVRTIESLHLRSDGVRVNVSVTCSLISEPLGVSSGVALIVHEITDRKRLEAQLREYAHERESSDRRKTDFIAMLGHELRSPLNVLITALRALDETPDQSLRDQLPAMCLRNARYMARLVEELLDLSRISRDELQVVPRRVSVQQVCRRAVELAGPVLEEHRQKLDLTLPPAPLRLFVDDVRIAQAIVNLLDNAAKYSPAGGSIRLEARERAGRVAIQVQDEGAGIPEELVGKVFEPFVQGEPARSRARSGLGLGLALVRRIVELHGGTVTVKSAGIKRGSTFTITLPRDGEPSVNRGPVPT
jgi:two-component system, chemotaxis family, CheB/CheR fusion protein